jgi:hypothetical protein
MIAYVGDVGDVIVLFTKLNTGEFDCVLIVWPFNLTLTVYVPFITPRV